jgi:hypothetical protein
MTSAGWCRIINHRGGAMEPGQARVERRLAAILAADVAGYSRLIEADEEGTLGRLKALRAEIIDPKRTRRAPSNASRHRAMSSSTRRAPRPHPRAFNPGTRPPATAGWRPGDDRGSISASNSGAAVAAGQIEKLALDVGEQTWRKEAVGENPRPTRYGLEASIRPLVDIMLGDDDPTRFVVQPDRLPDLRRDLDPDGITRRGECVIGRITTKRGCKDQSLAATRQAGRSLPWLRPTEAARSHR